nr:hypothetical protein [Tanacetum cinerariifolium]
MLRWGHQAVCHSLIGQQLFVRGAPVSYFYTSRFVLCNSADLPLYARSEGATFCCTQTYLAICSRDYEFGLHLFVFATTSLVDYTDDDWEGCPSTCRSTSGYCVFLGDNILSWSVKRQHTISRSSAKAKYWTVANVVTETAWVRNLLRELHSPFMTATLVYCDNFADIFTKGLPSALFEDFRSSLSVRPPPALTFFIHEKDDPHDHIRWFNKITSTIKYKDVPNSAIKLMRFPFSITEAARRITNLRNKISNFQQRFDESFHVAWDRYKDLLRACPYHGFTELNQLDTFYNALNPADQDSLNAAAGGNLLERRTQDVLTIIENKSKVRNSQNKSVVSQVKSCDANSNSSSEIAKLTHAVNQQTSDVTTAMTAILKQFQSTPPPASVKAVEEICVTYGGAHPYYQCLAAIGNTFPELRDNIQGYVSAAAVNYNQGNSVYRPPANFVIVDYANDLRVPLFLGIPFLQTAHALIDVHGEEMILHDGDERLTLNMRHDTLSYSNQPPKESINLINDFNNSGEDFLEDLFSNQPSGNPTFSSHLELTSSKVKNNIFDSEGGNVLHEKLLDLDSTKNLHPPLHVNLLSGSTTYSSSPLLEELADELALITFPSKYDVDLQFDVDNLANPADNFVDSMPEVFTDEHALDYSSPPIFDEYDDDFFEVEFDTENVYDDPFM